MGEQIGEMEGAKEEVIFRDIRRYYCDYCGISRSKKSLLTSHFLSHHQEELKKASNSSGNSVEEERMVNANTCEECGTSFHKPAHLRQHMLSHSLDKSILQQHLKAAHLMPRRFACRIPGCDMRFSYKHGGFVETDKQFRLRPRGGHKSKCSAIESLSRKRVVLPSESESMLN